MVFNESALRILKICPLSLLGRALLSVVVVAILRKELAGKEEESKSCRLDLDPNRGGRVGKEGDNEWVLVTKLGRLVKDRKIATLEEIFLNSLPIKEFEIIDALCSNLKDESTEGGAAQPFLLTEQGLRGLGQLDDREQQPFLLAERDLRGPGELFLGIRM